MTRRYLQDHARRLLLLLAVLLLAQPAAGETLTIDAAVQMALQRNESFLAVKTELGKADAEVKGAVAGALPHLDFSSNLTRNHEIPTVVFGGEEFRLGTKNNIDLNLRLTQPIYMGGKVFTALKVARIYRKYTKEMVGESQAQLVFGVRQAFLGAILAQDQVAVFRDAVATADYNLDMVRKMAQQGMVADYDVLRAEVESGNLRPQLTQAENQAEIALDQLRNMVGLKSSDSLSLTYSFDTTLTKENFSLSALQERASAVRPLLREQEYYQQLRDKAISIAKSGRRPNVSLSSGLSWSYQRDDLLLSSDNFTRSWSTTLNISMPIFDGFSTSAEVKKARLDYRASELQLSQTRNQVEIDVRGAFLQYGEASERLQAQAKTVDQAQEGLRIARLRYESGVGTQLEVLSAESALTQAKTNYVQATHDAALAVYRIMRVTGIENWDELKEL